MTAGRVAGALLAVALLLCLSGGVSQLARPGYLLDEEITAAVAPSIPEHGVPRLPSGILYPRGVPYTYAASIAGAVFGQTLMTYRAVSLVFALLAVAGIFWAGTKLAGPLTGGAAAIVLAAFTPFSAAAAFGRPYTFFVAVLVLTIGLLQDALQQRRSLGKFLVALVCARLLHEFGAVVAGLPWLLWIVLPRGDARRQSLMRAGCIAVGIIAVLELAVFAAVRFSVSQLFLPMTIAPAFRPLRLPALPPLHLFELATPLSFFGVIAAPLTGLAVLLGRRTGRWMMPLACLVLAMAFQLGLLTTLVLAALIVRPGATREWLAVGSAMFMGSTVAWTAHTLAMSAMTPSWSVPWHIAVPMFSYPLAALQRFATLEPATLLACAAALFAPSSVSAPMIRALSLFALITLMGFAAFHLVNPPRFQLVIFPVLAIVAAHGLVRGSETIAAWLTRRDNWASAAALVLCACLASATWINHARRDQVAPITTVAPNIQADAGDLIICTEELACRYLLGRIDYLLLVTDVDLAYYTGRRDGLLRGLYGNAPVLTSAEMIESVVQSLPAGRRAVLVVFDSGKVYEIECREIAQEAAATLGGSRVQTDLADVFYFKRGAAGIAAGSSAGSVDGRFATVSIR